MDDNEYSDYDEYIKFNNGTSPYISDKIINKMQRMIRSDIENVIKEKAMAENPVGHIRMETTDTNPAEYLGFGTWELWGQGRVPVGVDTTQTEFNTVEKIGGEKTHILTQEEMAQNTVFSDGTEGEVWAPGKWDTYNGYTLKASGGKPITLLQPYITCYMWKRTD